MNTPAQQPRDFASLFGSGRPEDWEGFEEAVEGWRREVMTSEQIYKIPKQPFPSCLSIDQTVGFLTGALKALEHAPESKDVDRARTFIEEGIADVEAYRDIHSTMREWGQGWKDAFLEDNKQKAAIFAQLVSLQAGSRRATLDEIAESVRDKYQPEHEGEGMEND